MKRILLVVLSLLALQLSTTGESRAQLSVEDLLLGDALPSLGRNELSGRSVNHQSPTILPFLGNIVVALPSDLEILYSERTGKPMLQFGYDVLGQGHAVQVWPMSGAQEDYILGPGDRLQVTLRGKENISLIIQISHQGEFLLPELEPIMALGRTFGDFTVELESKVEEAFLATQVFVSIADIRGMSILVSGDVNLPGIVAISGLSTVIDALILAGGVKKTGTLRAIEVHGPKGIRKVDLYAVLSGYGEVPDLTLKEGERIYVPPLGRTMAISGSVGRPGVYEIREDDSDLSASDLLMLGGGIITKGQYRTSVVEIMNSGKARITTLNNTRRVMNDGEILIVEPKNSRVNERVTLTGHVTYPGAFPLSEFKSLSILFSSENMFIDQPYLLFAILSRLDPKTLSRQYIPFSPTAVFDGRFDIELAPEDIVRVFSLVEIREVSRLLDIQDQEISRNANRQLSLDEEELSEEALKERVRKLIAAKDSGPKSLAVIVAAESARTNATAELTAQSSAGAMAGNNMPADGQEIDFMQNRDRLLAAQSLSGGRPGTQSLAPSPGEAHSIVEQRSSQLNTKTPTAFGILDRALDLYSLDREIELSDPIVWQLLYESRLSILGAVKAPGNYPAAVGTTLGEALAVAGGPVITADLSSVEITRSRFDAMRGASYVDRQQFAVTQKTLGSIVLGPLDVIRIRSIFLKKSGGQIAVTGELKFPGTFDIMRGERLSSIFDRAGGLTETAYPYGAIFLRKSIAETEQIGFNRMADEIQSQLITAMTLDDLSGGEIQYLTQLLSRMRSTKALGRMSVKLNPESIRSDPKLDFPLENGDRIHVPQRPTAVTVLGEVLMAGSYQFVSGTKAKSYIKLAGGYSKSSDRRRAFIIYPDGTARRLDRSLFSFSNQMIAPGTTIMVPRDLTPFQFFRFATEITQITSQLAVTAASLAVLADRN